MIRGTIVILCCLISFCSFGQLSVAVSASADTINFGDEVQLTYKLNVPQDVDVTSLDFTPLKECLNLIHNQMPEQLDSIMDVDVVDGGAFKINNNNLIVTKVGLNGQIPLQGSIRVRVSSVGAIDLPRPIIGHLSNVEEMRLSSPRLFVKPIGALEDINPNWDIIEEEISWRDYLKYLYYLLGVIALGLIVFFAMKRINKQEEYIEIEKEKIIFPAHEKAVQELNVLKGKELWQNGDTKGYHTELTRIMRQYIEDRYSVNALEMTSSQLKREMSKNGIDNDIIRRFDDILQIADKVKFAKGDAGPEINVRFMDEAYKIVEDTKVVETAMEEEK